MDVDKEFEVPFPREQVYAAWVSSETIIPPAVAMKVEPEVGGIYQLTAEGPGFTAVAEGRFDLVEPNERVRYSWEWNGDGNVSTIDVRFSDSEAGTTIHMLHTGLHDAEAHKNHDEGWQSYVAGLSQHLADR